MQIFIAVDLAEDDVADFQHRRFNRYDRAKLA
jgi:hypothetical protein